MQKSVFFCLIFYFLHLIIINKAENKLMSDTSEINWTEKQSSIFKNLIQHFQWSKFIILSDDKNKISQENIIKQFSNDFIYATITSIEKSTSLDLKNINAVMILTKETTSTNSILEIIQNRLQRKFYPRTWVFINRDKTVHFEPFYIPHDVNIFLIDAEIFEKIWNISQLYYATGNVIIQKYIGFGNTDSNTIKLHPSKQPLPKFPEQTMRITSIPLEPYYSVEQLVPKDGGKPRGYFGEIFRALQEELNFSYIVEAPADQLSGVIRGKNGTGMMGKLCRNESDMSVALIYARERIDAVDYSIVLNSVLGLILYRKLDGVEPRFFFYLEPLSSTVWACIGCLTVFVALMLTIKHRYYTWDKNNKSNKSKSWLENIMDYVIDIFYTLLGTGVSVVNFGLSSNIMMQMFQFFTILITISYSSKLTSILAVSKPKIPFEAIEDFINKTDYAASTIGSTSTELRFRYAKSGTYAEIWKRIAKDEDKYLVDSVKEAMDLLYTEKAAFFLDGAITTLVLNGNCSFRFNKIPFVKSHFGLGYRKSFPYLRLFDRYLLNLKENGIVKKLITDDLPGAEVHHLRCKDQNVVTTIKLNLVFGLFYTLLLGIVISLLIFVSEICIYKFK